MELAVARVMAARLMQQHGLLSWGFKFDRARKRFGRCSYKKRTITLSAALTRLNDEAHVQDTILHEIAHALAGPAAKHGPKWKAVARSIGAATEARYDAAKVTTPDGRWQATCPGCGVVYHRHRRGSVLRRQACTPCCRQHNGGKFDERFMLRWHDTKI